MAEETPADAGQEETLGAGAGTPGGAMSEKDEKLFSMLCHLSALILGALGPLIFWLIKKDDSPMVDAHGKESLNFQISVMIYMFAASLAIIILIGLLLLPAIWLFDIVMIIIASIKANEGTLYRYPLTIRLIK